MLLKAAFGYYLETKKTGTMKTKICLVEETKMKT